MLDAQRLATALKQLSDNYNEENESAEMKAFREGYLLGYAQALIFEVKQMTITAIDAEGRPVTIQSID